MKRFTHWAITLVLLLIAAFAVFSLMPASVRMPVKGATSADYNPDSFWHPWGDHRHRGIDIFSKKGTAVTAAAPGIVISTFREFGDGGNNVAVLGSRLRIYYYAHLDTITTNVFSIVGHGSEIGRVGNTGNAKGTPPHLHFSISSPIPQGDYRHGKLMYFINPVKEIEHSHSIK